MEAISNIYKAEAKVSKKPNFMIDTSFVLFFLAVDLGQNFSWAFDAIFLAITLLAVAILPYFLISDEKPKFGNWFLGRSLIVVFAVLLGLAFRQSIGVVLPESFSFLPFTLLIVTAMLSCYIQFYGFFKLRLSK